MTDISGIIGIAVAVVALVASAAGVVSSYVRRNTQFEDHCSEDERFREGLDKRLCKLDEMEKRIAEVRAEVKLAAQKADLLWGLIERHAGRLLGETENPITGEQKARIVSGELTVEEAEAIVADLEHEIECHADTPPQALVHILVEAHVKRLILDKHGVRL